MAALGLDISGRQIQTMSWDKRKQLHYKSPQFQHNEDFLFWTLTFYVWAFICFLFYFGITFLSEFCPVALMCLLAYITSPLIHSENEVQVNLLVIVWLKTTVCFFSFSFSFFNFIQEKLKNSLTHSTGPVKRSEERKDDYYYLFIYLAFI